MNTLSEPDALLKKSQTCAEIGYGPTWLDENVAAGNFPKPVKIGRSVRWSRREVQAWIRDQLEARDNSGPLPSGQITDHVECRQ